MGNARWLAAALVLVGACVLRSETVSGPEGKEGPQGEKGEPGVADAATLAEMKAQLAALQEDNATLKADLAALTDDVGKLTIQVDGPECPPGYSRVPGAPATFLPTAIVCAKGDDQVVKVGAGSAAFWIDRYEASLWTTKEGPTTGAQKFAPDDDTDPVLFPKTGQVVVPYYALSVAGKLPSASFTWFQAMAACSASGKRLPSRQEWLLAARGTVDPGSNDGSLNKKCNTNSSGPRFTGLALASVAPASCVSDWDAEDMIGNRSEFTDEWYAGVGNADSSSAPWPDGTMNDGDYHGDGTWNIVSIAISGGLGPAKGIPSAAHRGGNWGSGSMAGIFALTVERAPSDWNVAFGVRCVIPR